MRLLRHFVPDTSLSLDTIKRILAQVEGQNRNPAAGNINGSTRTPETPKQTEQPNEYIDPDDGSYVLEDTGSMIKDPTGKYRWCGSSWNNGLFRLTDLGYVDADSSLRFDHAARIARQSHSSQSVSSIQDPAILSPFITGMHPATSPQDGASLNPVKDLVDLRFPSREICARYIDLFFEQVHCIYWVFSAEQFYSQLDKALEHGPTSSSPSWLCSFYSIFTIVSALPMDDSVPVDINPPSYYLSIAKYLSLQACEVADVESLQAMVLLVCVYGQSYAPAHSHI